MARLKKQRSKVQKVVKKAQQSPRQAQAADRQTVVFSGEYTEAVGRRKVASARVRLYPGKEGVYINGLPASEYFDGVMGAEAQLRKPLELTKTDGQYGISAHVSGSGISAQLDAVVHGVARALDRLDPANRAQLKPVGLLTRDPRMKETRKIGRGGKARRKRQSPKR